MTEHEVATMDATSAWTAVRALRAWERERLSLRDGERLMDIGCGPGDAGIALGVDLAPGGEVVGVDSSDVMLRTARRRATGRPCPFRAVLADAAALPAPDRSCDAARAERTLQWLTDPAAAIAEMRRVLRPGGRLALIDTDWSSLLIETGDESVSAIVRAHMGVERRRPSHVGRRLWGLAHVAGFVDLEVTAATHVTSEWDPDRTPAPAGFPPIAGLAVDVGEPRLVTAAEEAARAGRLVMAVTIYSVAGRRP